MDFILACYFQFNKISILCSVRLEVSKWNPLYLKNAVYLADSSLIWATLRFGWDLEIRHPKLFSCAVTVPYGKSDPCLLFTI